MLPGMRARAAVLVAGLIVDAFSGAAVRAAPVCQPGTLLPPPPYLPQGLVLTPAGDDLILVDRGALTVRDPATLAVKRTLLPQMNQWARAYVSADGALLWTETRDGLRFTFDTATWRATRLDDDRAVVPGEAFVNDQDYWTALAATGTSSRMSSEAGFWNRYREPWGLPPLPAGAEATAVAQGIMRTRGGKSVLDPLDPIAPGDDPTPFRVVVADTLGTVRLLGGDGKEIASTRALAGASVACLEISGGRILAALVTGEVVILTPELQVERRATVLPAVTIEGGFHDGREHKQPARHGIVAMAYDPARQRLFWISTQQAVGVFDLAAERTTARIAGTGAALTNAFFVDGERVALLSREGVSLWDSTTGRLLKEKRGTLRALFAAGGGLLTVGPQGSAQVLDARTLQVRRTICFLPQGCEKDAVVRPAGVAADVWGRMTDAQKERIAAALKGEDRIRYEQWAKTIVVAASPDGRWLAVLAPPIEHNQYVKARAGVVALWDARTVTLRRSARFDDCWDGKIRYASPAVIDVCGSHRYRADTLALLPGAPERPDPTREPPKVEATPVAGGAVRIWRRTDASDHVWVGDPHGKLLLSIANPERKEDELGNPDEERTQLRSATFAGAAPGGRRFLIGGRGTGDDDLSWAEMLGAVAPLGALQIWCTPVTRASDDRTPAAPALPAVGQFDGITEIALDGFPDKIVSAAEVAGGAWVLGTDAAGKAPALVELPAAGDRALPLPLPPGGPWEQLIPSPLGETAWLRGKTAVARRDGDGGWTTFALPPGASTRFFAPFTSRAAVHVVEHGCTRDQEAAARSEANLRDFYARRRSVFAIPARVEGLPITLNADVGDASVDATRAALQRRADAVAALLRAPHADFAAVRAQAVKDPKIGALADSTLFLSEDGLGERQLPLARLFGARAGEIVGPIATATVEADGVTPQRLTVQFVRVDKVTPSGVRPYADLRAAADSGSWWPLPGASGNCAEVTIFDDAGVHRRTVLPPYPARDVVVFEGGFGALGNPLLTYRDGAWLPPASPLPLALEGLKPDGVFSAARHVYVRRRDGLAALDPASGRLGPALALPAPQVPLGVQEPPGAAAGLRVWTRRPTDSEMSTFAVGSDGQMTNLGPVGRPVWTGSATLAPGRTADWWTTDNALLRRSGTSWRAYFSAKARRRGLAQRRRGRE
jgi:hypothetical protein